MTDADWDKQSKSYLRKNQPKSTPLKYALANCKVPAANLLIDRGADVKKHLTDLLKIVHWHEDADMAKLILPFTEKENQKGETPLSVAFRSPKAKKEGILTLIEKVL